MHTHAHIHLHVYSHAPSDTRLIPYRTLSYTKTHTQSLTHTHNHTNTLTLMHTLTRTHLHGLSVTYFSPGRILDTMDALSVILPNASAAPANKSGGSRKLKLCAFLVYVLFFPSSTGMPYPSASLNAMPCPVLLILRETFKEGARAGVDTPDPSHPSTSTSATDSSSLISTMLHSALR